MKHTYITLLVLGLIFISCGDGQKPSSQTDVPTSEAPAMVMVPKFDSGKAFENIEKQLDFGFRIPGTEGHQKCKNWLVQEFKNYGAQVIEQDFKASFFDQKNVDATNIIASFNPEHPRRILLGAHWDTRAVAEKDQDESRKDDPIMGADDGGSGVAVLLEIARLLKERPLEMGVDIILFDAEDNGDSQGSEVTWCLGAQHWAKNPHVPNYKPLFGILVDMVGARNAQFPKEGHSMNKLPAIVNKVWSLADKMGFSNYFIDETARGITDDHYFVMAYAGIPMMDIINLDKTTSHGFGHYHHTHKDDIELIDKRTLRAVGQVVTAVVYNVHNQTF